MIHGTDDPRSIGKPVSHGCIRVPRAMLETIWKATNVGTEVYIYESLPAKTQRALNDLKLLRQPERHGDLD